jgi:hypothetical protein
METAMADDDEVLPDDDIEISDGTEGEGTEGPDPGEGDDDAEGSTERADAPPRKDDGSPRVPAEGDDDQRPVSRGSARVQRAIEERNALREELAAIRREREADRQNQAAQQQQWTEQQWAERWAVMTPEEKIEYVAQQGEQRIRGLQSEMGMQARLMKDQMGYEARASVNPVYAKYQEEVERIHHDYAQRGQFIAREGILKQLLGERALASATGATRKAQKQGQKKIEAQTTRPTSSKGDAASTRGKSGDSAEKRLAGVEI